LADVGLFVDAIQSDRELCAALAYREALPGAAAKFESELPAAFEALRPLLAEQKIRDLYTHQFRALRSIESGNNLVLATPTASGKTISASKPEARASARF